MIEAKKYLLKLFSVVLLTLALMSLTVFLYDPFCYYRIPENRFIVNNIRYINAGLIRTADYDTAIVGSSMMQNFDMSLFRSELNQNPIKLSMGGMSVQGSELIMKKVSTLGKAKNYLLDINIASLNKEKDNLEAYATYLFDENLLNDYKYWLGYEVWMRLLPLNIAFDALNKAGTRLPDFYGAESIDNLNEWYKDAKFSGEILKRDYLANKNQVSTQDADGMSERMKANTDLFIDNLLKYQNGSEISIFFPPYSALYWYDTQQKGFADAYLEIKAYMVDRLEEKPNFTIYDFQTMPEIQNLDNYKDTTHYSKEISDLMVLKMSEGKYVVDSDTIKESNARLLKMIDEFHANNVGWLPK